MVPPPVTQNAPTGAPWGELEPDEKRERVLDLATEVFTEQGLDVPMPRIAAAAGVGIGSLYRSYRSKEDLVAALLVRQLGLLREEVLEAGDRADAWTAIEDSVRRIAERQATNKLLSGALGLTSERREVVVAVANLVGRLDRAGRPCAATRPSSLRFVRLGPRPMRSRQAEVTSRRPAPGGPQEVRRRPIHWSGDDCRRPWLAYDGSPAADRARNLDPARGRLHGRLTILSTVVQIPYIAYTGAASGAVAELRNSFRDAARVSAEPSSWSPGVR
jgi:AcrR family transcriptional regulator